VLLNPELMAFDAAAADEALGDDGVAVPEITTEPVFMTEIVIRSALFSSVPSVTINFMIFKTIASTIARTLLTAGAFRVN